MLLIGYLLWRQPRGREGEAGEAARTLVSRIAVRLGCPAENVLLETVTDAGGTLAVVRVEAPPGFPTGRLALELQAEVHNQGGRLEPVAHPGPGVLAALDGVLSEQRLRVEVRGKVRPATPTARPGPRATPAGTAAPGHATSVPTAPRTRGPGPGRLAIVLDDAGNSMDPLGELARLPRAVAVAVLPNTLHPTEFARSAAAQGREVLLHMPMDRLPGNGPGPGDHAIGVELTDAEVAARLERALALVPEARGVNNHMGSSATADRRVMAAVMSVLAPRGLYFLDSRTTAATVAEDMAREDGVPALRRDVFLDNEIRPDAILESLREAIARARAQGSAVAIGHIHPTTLAVLATELPRELGDVRLVPPSDLLR